MHRHQSSLHQHTRGFSLVEVVLALAIASIAIISVLGALGTAMSTAGENDRDTLLVAMSERVMTDLRALPFDQIWQSDMYPANAPAQASAITTATATPLDTTLYFDGDGRLLVSITPSSQASYVCIIKKTPEDSTRSHLSGECNQMGLQLVFQWPVSAPAANRTSRTLFTRIARS